MFDAEEIKEAVGDSVPEEWLNAIWMNHSDLPDENHPTMFRCTEPERPPHCTHNYEYRNWDNPNLPDYTWSPISVKWNKGYMDLECEEESVQIEWDKFVIFLGTNMREAWIGRCPICGRVHYMVERFPNEWFGLSWNEPD